MGELVQMAEHLSVAGECIAQLGAARRVLRQAAMHNGLEQPVEVVLVNTEETERVVWYHRRLSDSVNIACSLQD